MDGQRRAVTSPPEDTHGSVRRASLYPNRVMPLLGPGAKVQSVIRIAAVDGDARLPVDDQMEAHPRVILLDDRLSGGMRDLLADRDDPLEVRVLQPLEQRHAAELVDRHRHPLPPAQVVWLTALWYGSRA